MLNGLLEDADEVDGQVVEVHRDTAMKLRDPADVKVEAALPGA